MSHRDLVPYERRLRIDVAAFLLLILGLVVALALFSYQPTDPPASTVYPRPETATNWLGTLGAMIAQPLYDTLGVAVYVLLATWFVFVVFLFQRRRLFTWFLRLAGWLLLLPSAALGAEYMGPDYLGSLGASLTGSGGSLGAWLADLLDRQLSTAGKGFVLAACVLLGVLLAIDFAVVRVFAAVGRAMRAVSRVMARILGPILALVNAGRPATAPGSVVRAGQSPREEIADEEEEENPLPARPTAAPSLRPIPIHHHQHANTAPEGVALDKDGRGTVPISRGAAISDGERFADFELPPLTLLEDPAPFPVNEHDQELRATAALLEKTFTDFGLKVRVVGINTGPVITQFEIALETGLRVHKVTGLADDLALNLKVPSVRIVAPIPGKNTVGIEVPNEHRAMVRLKEVMQTGAKRIAKMKIPLLLGKDTEGRPLINDLAEMPHLLIAGRTGTGKSVCMNAIILSILMTRRPDEVKTIMIDPKMLELSEYGKIPHLMHPIVKDMKKAEAILAWAVDKMEERYDILSRARVRNIAGYNELPKEEILSRVNPVDEEERKRVPDRMPYIVIFVDEMGDLMMTMKKEVEGHIIRLAQKSRAAGIHLVVATQKPTVDVITGLIKSNLPARICFQVSSRSDSRVVLDEMGADKLLGKGDMLVLQPGTSTLIRSQGTYASDGEISRVVAHLECDPCYAPELIQLKTDRDNPGGLMETLRARDELYESAIEVILREGRGSVSLLQRALGIGYGRAARLIDFMAEDGIVGAYNGSSAREVLYTPEQWEEMKAGAAS